MPHPHEALLEDMVKELEGLLKDLGEVTNNYRKAWEKGLYAALWLKPIKRLATTLSTTREVLVVVTTFDDLQQRTVKFAKNEILASKGRLESSVVVVAHQDERGDASLREWGREEGLLVLPVFMARSDLQRTGGLERLLSTQLFTHDPFDLTGPVRGEGQFFGRSDATEVARRLLRGGIKAYFGIRKIGKTSMLNRIVDQMSGTFSAACIMVDCQRDALCFMSAAQLLDSIAGAVIDAVEDSTNQLPFCVPGFVAFFSR